MKSGRRWRSFTSIVSVVVTLCGTLYILIQAGYLPTPAFLMKRPAPPPLPAVTRDGRWHNYPDGDPLTLEPDIRAVVTMGDLLAGRDPALAAALQP